MPITFTSAAAKRIIAAVKKVEAEKGSRVGDATPHLPPETEVFMFLSSCDTSGMRYSGFRVFPVFDDDSIDLVLNDSTATKWKIYPDSPVFAFSIYEQNNGRGLTNRVVRAKVAGFRKSDNAQCFMFESASPDDLQGTLPIHDHRDNITGGGFAFSCYHPGTSLPSQNFHP